MQPVPITTKVLSLNPAHGRVYSIQHYVRKFVRSVVFSRYSDLDEILFPSRLWCCELISIIGLLWWPFWIQNGHQNTKNPPIWTKFGFQVEYDVANWYPLLVCYGGHFESKMATKIQKASDWDEIWFPSRLRCCELISIVGLW